ncbi:MAG TPA: hypothetical protein VFZ40_03790, partial [Pyrinomonadaceae bacterium]
MNPSRQSLLGMLCLLPLVLLTAIPAGAQPTTAKPTPTAYLLRPARIFDGESAQLHTDWVVLVRGEKIEAVGPAREIKAPAGAKIIELRGLTLMPGM